MKNMRMVRAGKNAFLIDAFKQKKYCMSWLGASDLKDKSDEDIKRLMKSITLMKVNIV